MEQPSWKDRVSKEWKQIHSVTGDGPFAVIMPCGDSPRIMLHEKREDAERLKEWIDDSGCGEGCRPRRHQLVDLRHPYRKSA
jgi:hypothetical protein